MVDVTCFSCEKVFSIDCDTPSPDYLCDECERLLEKDDEPSFFKNKITIIGEKKADGSIIYWHGLCLKFNPAFTLLQLGPNKLKRIRVPNRVSGSLSYLEPKGDKNTKNLKFQNEFIDTREPKKKPEKSGDIILSNNNNKPKPNNVEPLALELRIIKNGTSLCVIIPKPFLHKVDLGRTLVLPLPLKFKDKDPDYIKMNALATLESNKKRWEYIQKIELDCYLLQMQEILAPLGYDVQAICLDMKNFDIYRKILKYLRKGDETPMNIKDSKVEKLKQQLEEKKEECQHLRNEIKYIGGSAYRGMIKDIIPFTEDFTDEVLQKHKSKYLEKFIVTNVGFAINKQLLEQYGNKKFKEEYLPKATKWKEINKECTNIKKEIDSLEKQKGTSIVMTKEKFLEQLKNKYKSEFIEQLYDVAQADNDENLTLGSINEYFKDSHNKVLNPAKFKQGVQSKKK